MRFRVSWGQIIAAEHEVGSPLSRKSNNFIASVTVFVHLSRDILKPCCAILLLWALKIRAAGASITLFN